MRLISPNIDEPYLIYIDTPYFTQHQYAIFYTTAVRLASLNFISCLFDIFVIDISQHPGGNMCKTKGSTILKGKAIAILAIIIINAISFSFASSGGSGGIDYKSIYTGKNVYRDILQALIDLHNENPGFTELFYAGRSWDGRNIPVFRVGNGSRKILIDAEHHSREYITSILALNQIEYLINAYNNSQVIYGYNARYLMETVSFWFIPMVNPDGLELCINGTNAISNPTLRLRIPWKKEWPELKANARGVNLNRNYDAEWGKSKLNSKTPFDDRYPGAGAFSELETQAVRNLCMQYRFDLYITYHSSGEVIYWYFNQDAANTARDLNIAKMLSSTTGYTLVSQYQSLIDPERGGGSREWFVSAFKKPGFTIEVGRGASFAPVSFSEYNAIWNQNKNVPIQAALAILKYLNRTDDYSYKMIINGTIQGYESPKPVYSGTDLWIPLRQVSEGLGLTVTWDQLMKGIKIENKQFKALLNQDSRIAVVNGTPVVMPDPVKAINNSIYISARSLEAIAGLRFNAVNASRNIYVSGSFTPVFNGKNSIEKLFPRSRIEGEVIRETPLYYGTGIKSSYSLKKGTRVAIIDQDGDLYSIQGQDGSTGWINAGDVALFPIEQVAPELQTTQWELEIFADINRLSSPTQFVAVFHLKTGKAAIYRKLSYKWPLITYMDFSMEDFPTNLGDDMPSTDESVSEEAVNADDASGNDIGETGNNTGATDKNDNGTGRTGGNTDMRNYAETGPVLSFPLTRTGRFLYYRTECENAAYPLKITGSTAQWFVDNMPEGTRIYIY